MISATGATVIKSDNLEELFAHTGHIDLLFVDAYTLHSEYAVNVNRLKNEYDNIIVVLFASDNSECKKYVEQGLCRATILKPVGYDEILRVMNEFIAVN